MTHRGSLMWGEAHGRVRDDDVSLTRSADETIVRFRSAADRNND